MNAIFTVPPAAMVLLALVVSLTRPRAVYVAGLAALTGALAWAFAVPDGYTLAVQFLGFDVLLVSVDQLSRLLAVIFALIGGVAVLYARATGASPKLVGYALAYVGASLGAVLTGDWLTLVVAWELMAVTSTLLVWQHGGEALRAGFRYALMHAVGGCLFLAAVVWQYATVESFLFSAHPGIVPGGPAVLAALGIGVNLGFVGLHAWLPDTYPRPHIAASVFLCVYTTKTGVYALARAFPEGHLWIAYMGGAMAIAGVTLALLQDDMRRLLSYHIQSQVGYMVVGIGIGSSLATAGAMAHVFNHILYKSLLFMVVGALIYRTGRERLSELGGMGRGMPITAGTFVVAALSIAGFPGFNGFVSKGMLLYAAHHAHLDALWWLLLIAGVGTFMSFIKLGYYAFLKDSRTPVRGVSLGQAVPMVSVAGLCILFGVFPGILEPLLPGDTKGYEVFTTGHVLEGLGLAGAAVIGFALVQRQLKHISRPPDFDLAYNPLTVGGTTALVTLLDRGATLLDRIAIDGARRVVQMLITTELRRNGQFPSVGRADTGASSRYHASIGTGVLIVTVGLLVVLAAAL